MFLIDKYLLCGFFLLCSLSSVSAQWVSENYSLKSGWNAIWLSHDTSHESIDTLLLGQPLITEIWRWNTISSSSTFTGSPDEAVQADSQWLIWKRDLPFETTMVSLSPNAAYLVRVADSSPPFTLSLTGKPAPPNNAWAAAGTSFMGFPAQEAADAANTNFQNFFESGTTPVSSPKFFKYDGGPISGNPVRITSLLFEPVQRGRAYWAQGLDYTDYYGPLQVNISQTGLDFGDSGSAVSLTVKNLTDASLDAILTMRPSVAAPSGPSVAGDVPLQLQGALDLATGLFAVSDLGATPQITLAAGETKEMVILVNRQAMGGSAGDVFQSVLGISDSLDQTRVDIPVRAVTISKAGIWVGAALVEKVEQISAAPGTPSSSGENGEVIDGSLDVTRDSDANAQASFPLRLIFHRNETGDIRLLQQVYLGVNLAGELIATTKEANLDPARLADARRISSSHFPIGPSVLAGGADFGISGTLSLTSNLDSMASTNPFVHTYHPDHDEAGESQSIGRAISLKFSNDPADLGIPSSGFGSTVVGGSYTEILTGLRAQSIEVSGDFILYRVSGAATLSE